MIWYLAFLPFILIGGYLRKLIIVWAFLFFLVSTFVLQLSVLPYFEFLLLLVWFWDLLTFSKTRPLNMLYDDKCNLCDRTVRFLNVVDIFDVINFLPLSKHESEGKRLNVTPDVLRTDIYSWESGNDSIYVGYDFYLRVSQKVFLVMPLFPLLWLGKVLKVGPAVYRKLADYRIKVFGTCMLPVDTSKVIESSFLNYAKRDMFLPISTTALVAGIFFVFVLPVSPVAKYLNSEAKNIVRSAHILSWSRINVFNETDLKMTHHYFRASVLLENKEVEVPHTGAKGTRLSWHDSDKAYFGNSLIWRRVKNVQPILPVRKGDMKRYCQVARWGNAFGYSTNENYKFSFYSSDWPAKEKGLYIFDEPKLVGSYVLDQGDCK